MRTVAAINTSPRKQGTSAVLLDMLKDELGKLGGRVHIIHLYSHLKDMQPVFDAVSAADTIVISGPCYTNTYPADTTKLLQELAARPGVLRGQNMYGIIQGGMPYAHTHISGLNMLRIFAKKNSLPYNGGFIMGMGAMLDGQPVSKLLNGKKVERQLALFFKHIHNGVESPDAVYEASLLKVPSLAARILVALMNRNIKKMFAARGMDVHAPSPYLNHNG